jgi:hypothetical protein
MERRIVPPSPTANARPLGDVTTNRKATDTPLLTVLQDEPPLVVRQTFPWAPTATPINGEKNDTCAIPDVDDNVFQEEYRQALPLSTMPSQLSSIQLHVSVAGRVWPVHVLAH